MVPALELVNLWGSQTDFGGSDSPLSKDEYDKGGQRCGSPVWNLPMVFGPIVIAYNVNGLTSLNLNGASAAKDLERS
jgi:phosphate transport system substrate-binding protein